MDAGHPRGAEDSDFQSILDESIVEGLRYVLGESGLRMVLTLHPLRTFSTDPAKFNAVMMEIFKGNGAALIEREIARRLLEKAGRQRFSADQAKRRRQWSIAALGGKRRGRVSDRERNVLRRFLTLASLPQDHGDGVAALGGEPRARAGSIEQTSMRFAAAFKKGS